MDVSAGWPSMNGGIELSENDKDPEAKFDHFEQLRGRLKRSVPFKLKRV